MRKPQTLRLAHRRMAEIAFNALPRDVARKLGMRGVHTFAKAFREKLGDIETGYVQRVDEEAGHYIAYRDISWAQADIAGPALRIWVLRASKREPFRARKDAAGG